jgi:hypothetical protein
VLKDRASRVKHFQQAVDGGTAVLKLNDLMKPTKKRSDEIEGAQLLLMTSQEIDRRGEETSDEEEARLFMAEVLEKVRRGIRRLASMGFKEIIITADHGLVFPRGLVCLRAPGAEGGYFHGGISLQEVVIPVATIRVTMPPVQ